MKKKQTAGNPSSDHGPKRRDFLKQTAATGIGLMFVRPESVYGTPANSSLGLGIIGCGGRGNSDGTDFVRSTDVRVTALVDLFDDRLESTRARFDKVADAKGYAKIAAANIFKGWRSYEKLVQSKDVDIVLITSPPYFHPDHFAAAVAANKHIYLETPVATDAASEKNSGQTASEERDLPRIAGPEQ